MTPTPRSDISHRDRARLDGLRRLFRIAGAEEPDESDRAVSRWLVEETAGADQLLAHRLRRSLETLEASASGSRRAAE